MNDDDDDDENLTKIEIIIKVKGNFLE